MVTTNKLPFVTRSQKQIMLLFYKRNTMVLTLDELEKSKLNCNTQMFQMRLTQLVKSGILETNSNIYTMTQLGVAYTDELVENRKLQKWENIKYAVTTTIAVIALGMSIIAITINSL